MRQWKVRLHHHTIIILTKYPADFLHYTTQTTFNSLIIDTKGLIWKPVAALEQSVKHIKTFKPAYDSFWNDQ